ncbi:MAG TPA: hypothetical protein VNM47_03190, partial [Terriglobia bacterium]|nr:hypothetical protein [Terriglobia bacterium]
MKTLLRLTERFANNGLVVCELKSRAYVWIAGATLFCLAPVMSVLAATPVHLPVQYFRLMVSGVAQVQEHMSQQPGADLPALEKEPGWRHLPYSILAPAVLYAKRDPANQHYHDPKMLAEAIKLGDYFSSQNEKG